MGSHAPAVPQHCSAAGSVEVGSLGRVRLAPEVQEAGLMVQVAAHGHNLIRGIWQE